MAPSTAIGHHNEIMPMKTLIEKMIKNAENILLSWGFDNNAINTLRF
jgi:hypothetical protein